MNQTSDSPEELSPPSEADPQQKPPESAAFLAFTERFNGCPSPEEKISCGLHFMRSAISQEGSPQFREFWESRRLVLPCFRENLNPQIRSKLWGEYVELTGEARRLKEILEEQSLFAMEQIDLAIQAIDTDLANFGSLLAASGEIVFPQAAQSIQDKKEMYNAIQRELNLLNTLASRLNSLRKEVMKVDMRMRFKTKFFKKLSSLGDQIFPRRKELIEKGSAEFEKDVGQFVARYFHGEEVLGAPYYALREEIKALQGMAKILTLNSPVFSRTRLLLSECWDKIRVLEKEHKKVILEKRQASSESRQAIQAKVDELKGRSEGLDLQRLDREIDAIVQEMRQVSLTREDVRSLREELAALRAPHVSAMEKRERELEEAAQEKIRLKKEKDSQVKGTLLRLLQEGPQMDLEVLVEQFEAVAQEVRKVEMSKMEKQQIERQIRTLKDLIAEKKEQSLLNLSDDDRKTLDNLRLVLQQKKERRQEIKNQLETYRKTLGSSNLDFEKAMLYRELVEQEKELLEKANTAIEEIEQKIAALES